MDLMYTPNGCKVDACSDANDTIFLPPWWGRIYMHLPAVCFLSNNFMLCFPIVMVIFSCVMHTSILSQHVSTRHLQFIRSISACVFKGFHKKPHIRISIHITFRFSDHCQDLLIWHTRIHSFVSNCCLPWGWHPTWELNPVSAHYLSFPFSLVCSFLLHSFPEFSTPAHPGSVLTPGTALDTNEESSEVV